MTSLAQKNRRSAGIAALAAAGMLALGYASVPLYRMFCQVTGLNGTTQRVSEAEAQATVAPVSGRVMTIRFDANISPSMPWQFRPEHPTDNVTVGARDMAIFIAKNLSDRPVTGSATFNVTPAQAGKYFSKIQCFCFTEQRLEPGQTMRMPVIYYVDPKILDDPDANDVEEITLSYTFYPVDSGEEGR